MGLGIESKPGMGLGIESKPGKNIYNVKVERDPVGTGSFIKNQADPHCLANQIKLKKISSQF